MRSSKTEAIVIKKRNFQEKDRILTLFSRDRGKIEAIAKGSRRPGSRFSYFSDIGSIGQFYLYDSKSIPIITDYKSIFSPELARGNLNRTEKLSFGYKLIDRVFESDEPHPKTYEALFYATEKLSQSDDQLVFLLFVVNVISDLGLKPELHKCTVCGKKINERSSLFFRYSAGISHVGCAADDGEETGCEEIKLLRLANDVPYNKISSAYVSQKVFDRTYKIMLNYIEWNFGKILPEKVL